MPASLPPMFSTSSQLVMLVAGPLARSGQLSVGALHDEPTNRSKRMSSTLEMVICGWYELLRVPLKVTWNQSSELLVGRTPIFDVAPPVWLTLPRPVAAPQL